MKSLLFLLLLGITQPLEATIALAPIAKRPHYQGKQHKDRPKLITYHRPPKVFAPIRLGRENVWTAFALGLVLLGYAGQFFYSRREASRFMAVVIALILLMELIIVLCHPVVWLIRWIRLLFWQAAWRKRYRLCPGQ